MERAGHTVKSFLQRSNPFQTPTCGKKEDCFVCSTGGKGSCRAMGVTYDIVCVPCSGMPSPGRYRYIGETARNAYTRGREHLSMLNNRNKASVLWEHCRDVHSGNMVDLKCRSLRGTQMMLC